MGGVEDGGTLLAQQAHRVKDVLARLWVNAHRGFVHDHQPRAVHHGAGYVQPPLHPPGKLPRVLLFLVFQAGEGQRLVYPFFQQLPPQAVEPTEEGHVFRGGHVFENGDLLGDDPDLLFDFRGMFAAVLAENVDRSSVHGGQADQHVQRGRLPRAVGAKQAEDLSLQDLQVHVIHRQHLAVAFNQVLYLYQHGKTSRNFVFLR